MALAGLLAAVLAMAGGTAYWARSTGSPIDPDGGLQQLDLINLHERVPGVMPVAGQPTLVAAAGDLRQSACAAQADRAVSRHGSPTGLAGDTGLVVVVAGPVPPGLNRRPVVVRSDPAGGLARRLALPRAATGCYPGYVLVDPAGYVRYRSYDPDWGEHSDEQRTLLAALR